MGGVLFFGTRPSPVRLMMPWVAAISLLTLAACAATKPVPPKEVVRQSAKPGRNFPSASDFYPPASERIGESGNVDVRACVGTDGTLTAEPTVAKTSGISRLDDGALRLARAGSGEYMPATEDGRPVSSCFVFRVSFVLKAPNASPPATEPADGSAPAQHN